jgi:NhaA family Na+:H+ antiporter
VAAGLFLGKPVGILLGTWVASRLGGGLPDGLRLRDYVPVACFCGIGFTMALFITSLAFPPGSDAADASKIGVLLGTVVAFVLGSLAARSGFGSPVKPLG